MKKPLWPIAFIIAGYGLTAVCIAIILTTDLSENAHMWAIIGESFGVGVGSAGLGVLFATRRR
jgi:hypothetical protein